MRLRFSSPLLLLSLVFGTSQLNAAQRLSEAASAGEKPGENAEREVRDAALRRFKALTQSDLATLDRMLADELIYTHSNAHVDTKASYLASIRSGQLKYTSIVPDELSVRVYGETAVITGQAAFTSETNGQAATMRLRFTDVYVHRDGRWQQVAWESTRVPNP